MTEFEARIKNLADEYYRGNEQVSDQEYDALVARLRKEQPASSLLPENQGIAGSELKGVSRKYRLPITMGTLAKCNSDDELRKWWGTHPHDDIVAQSKLDGNSQVLCYKDGKFQYSRSRGDGEYGEDTTGKLRNVDIPFELKADPDFSGYIRGELYLKRSVWAEKFPGTKNPRNCAAGIVGRDDTSGCRYLSFCAYDVFDDDNIHDTEEMKKLGFLEANGFEIPEFEQNPSINKLIEWKDSLDTVSGEIPMDGIVIKQNKVDKGDLMRHTPLKNVAFKPNIQLAVTKIRDIQWDIRGRYLSPVAILEPVELEGTTVSRASLANVNIMRKLGVYIGAEVMVKKAGLIIPQVEKVLDPKKDAFEIPGVCPACGQPLTVNESGFVECLNESCPRKTTHRIKKLLKVFGVKGAGQAFLDALEKDGKDIFWLLETCRSGKNDSLNGYAGGINGEKILRQIKTVLSSEVTPAQVLALLDMKLFDQKRIEMLGDKTLDELLSLTREEIVGTSGFSDITADAYLSFISDCKDDIARLRAYFTFRKPDGKVAENKEEKPMTQTTVCFTGACKGYTRSELSDMAIKAGYLPQGSVTSKTNLLVCADPNSGSSKLQKAQKNGTKIISYDEFLETIGA